MTASAEVDRVGKGENSFSSFPLFRFVSFHFIFPAHCRLLEKKKAVVRLIKKVFRPATWFNFTTDRNKVLL